jgi:transcriptional regulator with XRE-family HTH domain
MEQICSDISENLKKIRAERNLTLDQLSEITGVSKSMLRQIETGNSIPTIATVWKIANGLKISFTSLFTKCSNDVKVGKIKDKNLLEELGGGYRVYPVISFDPKRPFEMYFLEMQEGISYKGESHEGNVEEFIAVLEGNLKINVDGQDYIVNEGEYISFMAENPHVYENIGSKMLKAVMVLTYF